MERGDFGLILYAATTRSFDFTAVDPTYYTRLNLILKTLRRINNGLAAAQSAIHCSIGANHGDEKSRNENYKRMNNNRDIYLESLCLEKSQGSDDKYGGAEALIKYWQEHYGNKKDE